MNIVIPLILFGALLVAGYIAAVSIRDARRAAARRPKQRFRTSIMYPHNQPLPEHLWKVKPWVLRLRARWRDFQFFKPKEPKEHTPVMYPREGANDDVAGEKNGASAK